MHFKSILIYDSKIKSLSFRLQDVKILYRHSIEKTTGGI